MGFRPHLGRTIHMEFGTRLILDELTEAIGFDENRSCFIGP
jgi:hypothetical protein